MFGILCPSDLTDHLLKHTHKHLETLFFFETDLSGVFRGSRNSDFAADEKASTRNSSRQDESQLTSESQCVSRASGLMADQLFYKSSYTVLYIIPCTWPPGLMGDRMM